MTPQPSTIPAGTRPFGWAGFLLPLPASFKLLRVTGDHARGSARLVDTESIRLEAVWATVTRKNFDAETYARKQLLRTLKSLPDPAVRSRAQSLADSARALRLPGFDPAYLVSDPQSGYDRLIGYCPATRRVFELAYRHGTPAEDVLFRDTCLPAFSDQPLASPMRWAFFGVSFIAPAGMGYHTSKLNMGDMQVQLTARGNEFTGPGLLVRQIYPARLALMRQPLENWAALWTRELAQKWRIEGCGNSGRKPPTLCGQPFTTHDGRQLDALEARGTVRMLFRPFLWRAPRAARLWLWHDPECDRLLGLYCTHHAGEVDRVIREAAQGMNWAGMEA